MVLVAFAVFALGRWARPSYELQMRGGGRRLRVFAIDSHQPRDQVRWCSDRWTCIESVA